METPPCIGATASKASGDPILIIRAKTGDFAFSLTELLIVIGLLVILVSLFLPAGAGMLNKSRESQCANNLRQIGTGIFSYVSENNGTLVPAAVISDNRYWFDALNPYMGFAQYGETYGFPPQTSITAEFPLKWQQCPAKSIKRPPREAVGYGWNYLNFGMSSASAPNFGYASKLVSVPYPGRTIIAGDSKDTGNLPDSTHGYQHRYLYPPYLMGGDMSQSATRHSKRGLYLMLDGHIEALTPAQLMSSNFWTKEKSL